MTTRVLVVDDSPTMRAILSQIFGMSPDIEVVGAAADAQEARAMIKQLDPDVVTLDIEMSGMSGLDFLAKIMQLRPMPVVIVSAITQAGCETTVRALELGAVDCVAKPVGLGAGLDEYAEQLIRAVTNAGAVRFDRTQPLAAAARAAEQVSRRPLTGHASITPRVIAIGASTGGVEALHHLLPSFPEDCAPTLIVQHISAAFASAMAQRLDGKCAVRVQLAEPGIQLQNGHVYVAPGNERHMVLATADKLTVRLMPGDPVSGHRPSIDAMFASVARLLGPAAVGILLTGMGADGARGLLAMRQAGAFTIAQDEATSTVYGMPRAAAQLGAAADILPLPSIAERALASFHRAA